jgi:hypothetical protein
MNQQRADLGNVIDAASGAATTAAAQAGNLRQTLIEAPQALTTLRSFITSVGQTASDLTPAAAQIGASAAPLDALLGRVRPFQRAAVPALNEAAAVSPLLTKLGVNATPIVKQALPTFTSLTKIAKLAYPLSYWLQVATPDLLGVMQGWSRSIQFRDGLGHVFHAEVDISPSVVVNLAKLGAPASANRRAGAKPRPTAAGSNTTAPTQAPLPPATTGSRLAKPLSGLLSAVSRTLGGVTGTLGGVSKTLKGVSSALGLAPSPPPSASGSSNGSNLTGLLKYLLGK